MRLRGPVNGRVHGKERDVYKRQTLIKLPEEHVKVPAKKTVTAKMTVEIPANGFQGLVLGGVYA